MPVVKRTQTLKQAAKSVRLHQTDDDVSLPEKVNTPPTEFFEYQIAFYGDKGIGKSSLLGEFPDAVINQWETGRRHLAVFQIPKQGEKPLNWPRFKRYIELEIDDPRIKTIGIDTAFRAFEACQDWVCGEAGILHPNDANDYGKTWQAVRKEFESVCDPIQQSRKTPVYIAHGDYREVDNALTQTKTQVYSPKVSGGCWGYLQTVCDFVFCLTYRGTERVAVVRGTETIQASCGVPDTFLHPDNGLPLVEIPLGNSSAEAYRNILLAYSNKLPGTVIQPKQADDDTEAVTLDGDQPKKTFKRKGVK
jgi:hypothetical protein